MRDYMEKVCELAVVRTRIKDLAEAIINEDKYNVIRLHIEELIELAEREKELTAYVKEVVMADIDERERIYREGL